MTDRHFVTVDPTTKALPSSVISGTGLFTSENDPRLTAKFLPRDEAGEGTVAPLSRVLDLPIDGVFTSNVTFTDMNTTVIQSKPEHIFPLWDALVTAHPDYITRTTLATEPSVDAFPIYLYDFNPAMGEGAGQPDPPKIILVIGQHGNEKTGIWHGYHFAENLCNGWSEDPIIEALRFNVRFLMVALANPAGMEANTAENANGVNPNRNWPAGWNSTAGQGTGPLSEVENAAIYGMIQEHDDAIMGIDVHNFMNPTNGYWFLWNVGSTPEQRLVSSAMMRRLDRKMKTELPGDVNQDPSVFVGHVTASTGTPTLAYNFGQLGIHGVTFETGRYLAPVSTATNTELVMKYGHESLVNLIALGLANL